jgi:anti-sigma B factor antagonist
MDLRLRVRQIGAAALVEIGGEIDLHSAPQLRAALLKAGEGEAPRLVVDLSEVTFIDSTGIGVLVGALKRARESGGDVHFCGVQARVRRVFEITGLIHGLPLFESRDAALTAFGGESAARAESLAAEAFHE